MPNRIISPKICTSPELNEKGLSWFDEVVFFRLLVTVDANGRIEADAGHIRATLFPRKPSVTRESIQASVSKLQSAGLIYVYDVNGIAYLQVARWSRYQLVRSKGVCPDPDDDETENNDEKDVVNNLSTICLQDNEKSENKEKIPPNPPYKEIKVKKETDKENTLSECKRKKPTVEEIAAYCAERKNGIDAQHFFDFYEARGWVVGKNKTPMKDFKAAVRLWEQQNKKDKPKKEAGFDLDEFFDLAVGRTNK